MTEPRTELEKAEDALASFRNWMKSGQPYLPGVDFISNPGLDVHILSALEDFVRVKRVAEQSKPAKRVSLTEA